MESNTTAIEFIIYALIIAATVVMFAVTLTAQNPEKKRRATVRNS